MRRCSCLLQGSSWFCRDFLVSPTERAFSHLGCRGLSRLCLSVRPWRGAPVPSSHPRHDKASSGSRTQVMHPNNWAMAQGHMLGTEPRSFFSLPTDRSFSLAPLDKREGHQHVNIVSLCPLQLRAASLRYRSSAVALLAVRGPLVCRFELAAALPVCLVPVTLLRLLSLH